MGDIEAAAVNHTLLQGLKNDAETEAQKIMAEAEAAVRERRAAVAAQATEARREAETRLREQAVLIAKNSQTQVAVEMRRLMLRVREQVVAAVEKRVEERMRAQVQDREYARHLEDWIVEAAIGLSVPQAAVNASAGERPLISQELLNRAMARVKNLVHRPVKLVLEQAAPLVAQGVVLSAPDGKTAFNNQVHTKLLRMQSEVRKIIHDAVFAD